MQETGFQNKSKSMKYDLHQTKTKDNEIQEYIMIRCHVTEQNEY